METRSKLFWLCLTGTILLAAGIVFLPRYLSRGLDMSMLNRVELAERENFSFLEQSSNGILENARAFRYLDSAEDTLMLISSYDESAKINSDLLEAVYDQAMSAADLGMLPWIGAYGYDWTMNLGLEPEPYEYWADRVRFARYYSLTYASESGSNTKEMLNFWYLRFSDGKTFDYYFLVNAATYQIYYAEIYNQLTDLFVVYSETFGTVSDMDTGNAAVYEKAVQEQSEAYVYDANMEEVYWSSENLFAIGSMLYYEANAYKYVGGQNLNNKLSLIVLNFGERTVYIEQLAMPENTFPYRGIGVGLQNLGASAQKLRTQ